jgi:hypothetical protein
MLGIGFVVGMIYHGFITKKEIAYVMKRFTDECESQYLLLLQKHGVRLNHKGNAHLLKTENYRKGV